MDVESTRGARCTSAPNRRAFWEEWTREALERGKVPPLPRGISREHLNVPLCEGVTPLIMAVKLKQYRTCVRIVRAGANIDLHDLEGKTPLIHAVETTQSDIVEFLLHKGCNPNKPDATGRTPLMYAAYMGSKEIMRAILSAGGDPAASDADGRAVTDYVAHRRSADEAQRLIKELDLPSGGRAAMSRRAAMRKHRFSHVVPEYIDYLHARRTVSRRFTLNVAAFSVLLLACDALIFAAVDSGIPTFNLLMYVLYGSLVCLAFFKAWSTVNYYNLVLFPGNTFGRFAPIFGWFGATGSRSAGEHPTPAQEGSSEEQAGQLAASLKGARALSNAFRFATRRMARTAPLHGSGARNESSAAQRRLGVLTAAWLGLVLAVLCIAATTWSGMWWRYRPGALIGPGWRSYPGALGILVAFATMYYLLLLPSLPITRARLLDAQRRRGQAASRFKDEAFGKSADPNSSGLPFALYLRSFRQDETLVVAGADFEAVLVHAIGQFCEVVALGGQDGEFGPARVSAPDTHWRDTVVQLAAQAQVIFVITFDTPGIIWEINRLVGSGMSAKAVFIMPPSSFVVADASHGPMQPEGPQSLEKAWRRMVNNEDLQQVELPGYNRNGCVFTLDADGRLRDWDALGMELLPWVLAPIATYSQQTKSDSSKDSNQPKEPGGSQNPLSLDGSNLPEDPGGSQNDLAFDMEDPGLQMLDLTVFADPLSGIDLLEGSIFSNSDIGGWGVDAGGGNAANASESGGNANNGGSTVSDGGSGGVSVGITSDGGGGGISSTSTSSSSSTSSGG